MGKRASLKKQVVDRLDSLQRFGQSKMIAKTQFLDQARAAGVCGWIPINLKGIYSIETMKSYRKESIGFTDWVKEHHGVKYLDDAKQHVSDYLRHRIKLGHSAWSLKLVRSALRKLYSDPSLASDVNLPTRRKIDIKRSRFPVAMDKEFSITRNRDLIDFAKAAGLRRHEVMNVMVKDVRMLDGKLVVFVPQGKGGKMRSVPILESMVGRVQEITQDKEQDNFLFERIPVRADVHGYRREYAQDLFKEKLENESPNGAKEITSYALGHERLNVLKNYLS